METFKENSSNRNNGTGEKEREQCSNIMVSRDSFPRHYERCPETMAAPTRGPPWGQISLSANRSFLVAEQHLPTGAVNFNRHHLLQGSYTHGPRF